MALPLVPHPSVPADVSELPSNLLRKRALKLLSKLKHQPYLGLPLDYRPRIGNLSDCRKLYFSEQPDGAPDYRIVYRLSPDEDKPKEIKIISVGPRANEEAYFNAVERLGRS